MSMINKEVHDFSVQAYVDNSFKTVSKADILGKWSVFFFYPADFTFVCPTELDMQETFTRAFLSIGDFRGETESSLTAWLYRIATNLAIRALQKRKRGIFSSLDSVRGDLLATFEHEVEPSADEIVVRLQRAILSLPTKQRLVFNMRYYDELSFEQISQATGQSVSTLKTNYHYAVQKIKEQVKVIEIE